MTKPQALKLVRNYNKQRLPDSNVRAILTYGVHEGYRATLVEVETGAIIGEVRQ